MYSKNVKHRKVVYHSNNISRVSLNDTGGQKNADTSLESKNCSSSHSRVPMATTATTPVISNLFSNNGGGFRPALSSTAAQGFSPVIPVATVGGNAANQANSSRKRKCVWNDFDFSDLNLDPGLPGWTNVSVCDATGDLNGTALGCGTSQKAALILEDIDFDDDDMIEEMFNEEKRKETTLNQDCGMVMDGQQNKCDPDLDDASFLLASENFDLLQQIDDSGRRPTPNSLVNSLLTSQDTDAMIELVKGDLAIESKSPKPGCSSAPQEEDYSRLLDDDLELCDLDSAPTPKAEDNRDRQLKTDDGCHQRLQFRTALGDWISEPGPEIKERARSLFKDIEQILLQEMAGYLWLKVNNQQSTT